MNSPELTDDERKTIFRSVIESQDAGRTVQQSRTDAAARFNITIEVVKRIEEEGIQREWPPL